MESKAFHYDLKSDTLFINDYDSNIHCILHPSMDQTQNRKNYRSPEQTADILKGKSDVKLNNITMNNNGDILENGVVVGPDFKYKKIGNYIYRVYSKNVAVYEDKNQDPVTRIVYNNIKPTEVNESVAVHPCGDIYILRYDSATKLHTLYCVENTWDTKWRKQWFKTHK